MQLLMREEERNPSSDPMRLYLMRAECEILHAESREIFLQAYLKEEEEKVGGREGKRWKEAIRRNCQAIDYFKKSLEAKKNYQIIEGKLWELAGVISNNYLE